MATGTSTHFDNAGRAVNVDLLYSVEAEQVAYVDGFLGITNRSGDSGDVIALTVDNQVYQFTFPAGLTAVKGDTVYIDTAQVTGHIPDEAGYSTSPGSGLVALCKLVEDKDASNNAMGILLPEGK